MTPKDLLEKLESLDAIDRKTLRKMRAQVEDPGRTVKTSAMLGYLVRKEQLTEEQARQLMRGETPSFSRRNTDDLLPGAVEEAPQDLHRTRVDDVGSNKSGKGNKGGKGNKAIGAVDVAQVEVEPAMIDPVAFDATPVAFDATPGGFEDFGDAAANDSSPVAFTGKKNTKDQWQSRWPYIGFAVLGFLAIIGTTLYFTVFNLKPDAMFKTADDNFKAGALGAAIKGYDDYLENFPDHKFAKEARAKRMNALLAESYESKLWEETLNRAVNKLPEFADNEENDLPMIRSDVALILCRSLQELTTKMLENQALDGMKANVTKAAKFKKLVDDPIYIPTSERKVTTNKKNLELIENNIRTLEGYIKKENDYSQALVDIKALGESGSTSEAFTKFVSLTRSYPDLGARAELREQMMEISRRESSLVKPAETQVGPAGEAEQLVVEQTVVLGSHFGGEDEGLRGEIIPTLVDGAIYGIDAGTGAIAWRRFVGLETAVHPIVVEEVNVLVSDMGNKQLLKLKSSDGSVIWRVPIEENFFRPAFKQDKLIVTTESGKVLSLDPVSGQLRASAQLPQGANTGALISEQDPLVYQSGIRSNLYVLSTDDLSCKDVEYLGHRENAIAVPPFLFNGYLVMMVNGGDYADMRIFKTDEAGLNVEPVQVIPRVANGPVSQPIERYRKWMLLVSENGQMVILQHNQGDEDSPVTRFASDSFESQRGQPAFFATGGSNLWVTSAGASHYKVKPNLGKFELRILKNGSDSFVAPCHKLDEKLLHVRKRGSSGMVSASLVDAFTLEPIWRNDFGGALAGPVTAVGGKMMAVSNQGDLFQLDGSGYSQSIAKASTIVESLRFNDTFAIGDLHVSVGGAGSREFVTFDGSGKLDLRTLSAPTDNPSCTPIGLGEYLIVPNVNGQVAAVDPARGTMAGEPFQPPVSPGEKVRWLRPVPLGDLAFGIATQAGRSRPGSLYVLQIDPGRSITSAGEIESTGTFVGSLATVGDAIYAAERVDETDALISVQKASMEKAEAKLSGKVIQGPWALGDSIFVRLDSDQLACFATDLTQRWVIPLSRAQLASAPQEMNGQLALVLKRGQILLLDPATGKESGSIDLGQPIADAPTIVDGKAWFAGLDGTVHVLNYGAQ